ncbi:hypothetical protein D4764_02G0010250 [Takifugu flavidus]|uniref:Uncharacterized protein n=1 Tax=Takifugu flavidus TaxID=433684 RepID=A0A5C6NKP8_9TELE|nr:hypothetical protein D4764_02G0010250 [Takifugu flavidus]
MFLFPDEETCETHQSFCLTADWSRKRRSVPEALGPGSPRPAAWFEATGPGRHVQLDPDRQWFPTFPFPSSICRRSWGGRAERRSVVKRQQCYPTCCCATVSMAMAVLLSGLIGVVSWKRPLSLVSVESPVEPCGPACRGRLPVIRRVRMLDPSRPVQVTNAPAGCVELWQHGSSRDEGEKLSQDGSNNGSHLGTGPLLQGSDMKMKKKSSSSELGIISFRSVQLHLWLLLRSGWSPGRSLSLEPSTATGNTAFYIRYSVTRILAPVAKQQLSLNHKMVKFPCVCYCFVRISDLNEAELRKLGSQTFSCFSLLLDETSFKQGPPSVLEMDHKLLPLTGAEGSQGLLNRPASAQMMFLFLLRSLVSQPRRCPSPAS